jgi:hypothetical protein
VSNLSTAPQETTEYVAEPVEVRTDARLAAVVGALAAVVAVAYLSRAIGGGDWLDWTLLVVTGAIATAHLQSFADARVPLLVVDDQGVRLRRGRTWHGLPWSDIECVEHEPRGGLLRDGRVVLVPRDADAAVHAVPLTLSTRVTGAGDDLTAALERLAPEAEQVVEVVPEVDDDWDEQSEDEQADEQPDEQVERLHDDVDHEVVQQHDEQHDEAYDAEQGEHPEPHGPRVHDLRPALARGIGFVAERLHLTPGEPGPGPVSQPTPQPAPEPTVTVAPLVASATPVPLREPVTAIRAEVRFDGAAALRTDPAEHAEETSRALPELAELRRDSQIDVIDALVLDQSPVEPAEDPVIGPELAAARTRLALTVDQLAERTRIRPHVIESIEVDDFAPCGGDFYARGHLRTLARVLGVDAGPLLAAYDERYSDAPIDARRVFEAELATGADGPIRGTRGGPNWSVLVAAVMAVVLAWSIVRLVMDSPVELHSQPILNNSAAHVGPAVPVVLDASAGGAHVVVRNGAGKVVFNGDLAYGGSKTVKASPPVWVQSSDGALAVTVDGKDRGPLGAEGRPASNTFAAAE